MAWPFTAGETASLVTTLFTSIGTLYVIIMQQRAKIQSNVVEAKVDNVTDSTTRNTAVVLNLSDKQSNISDKLEVVHDQTNSRMTRMEQELANTRSDLKIALAALTQAETTRKELAKDTAATLTPTANVEPPLIVKP